MSDPNKYVNYYIENAIGMVHENINALLQTKTQIKVLQDQVLEKDSIITSLQNELESHRTNEQELNQARAHATSWESSYNEMKGKVSHMDTLSNQIVESKKLLVQKNQEVLELTSKLEELEQQVSEKESQIKELKKLIPADSVPKKSINKKKSTSEVKAESNTQVTVENKSQFPFESAIKNIVVETESKTDDF